jgi:NitT/TauT family transport system substrate-binding protein
VFVKAFSKMRGCLSKDGLLASDAPQTVRAVLAAFDPGVAAAHIDLRATYDNSFAQKAAKH